MPNLSRETKSSGANGDRESIIFPVQLTTSRIGNLTRLILTLAICDDHTYIHIIHTNPAYYYSVAILSVVTEDFPISPRLSPYELLSRCIQVQDTYTSSTNG